MTVTRDALNSVVNSSYKFKMYYFTILGLNLPGGVSEFLWVTRKLKGSSDSAKDCPGLMPGPEISPA